jgi:hypothetical protein
MRIRRDPGPCPVDDMPHTTCTSPDYAITIVQLPARDGVANPPLVGALPLVVPQLLAEQVQQTLPPGQFTSGTYRKKRRP